ncbi:MAG: hypothetical protein AOA66_0997 [Candidatus Bathyarchaeota archaeon BA2]|nr:MAG: hypothetical protein AOA66_0997 [Candidatus Bathyarchaeota archaeon BA2]
MFTDYGYVRGSRSRAYDFCGYFLEYYLHEKRVKERLFKALYDEIQLNIYVAERTLKSIKIREGLSNHVIKPGTWGSTNSSL